MIVLNEERYLKRALDSVKNVADEVVVVDTGSTDSTLEIAKAASAKVLTFPWVGNFSAARNFSIEAAHSHWILILDADEELSADSISVLRQACNDPDAVGFNLAIDNRSDTSPNQIQRIQHGFRLFRNLPAIRYEGKVHEQAIFSAVRTRCSIKFAPITLFHYGYAQGPDLLKEKFRRNYALLVNEINDHPRSPYLLCHLAHAELLLGATKAAIDHYQKTLEILEHKGGIPEQQPFWAGAYDGMARAQMLLGQHEQAIATCRRGQRYFPHYPELIYLEGISAAQLMRHVEAKNCFARCLALHGRAWVAAGSDPALTDARAREGLAKADLALGHIGDTYGRRVAFSSHR